jgi:hypothetical protein
MSIFQQQKHINLPQFLLKMSPRDVRAIVRRLIDSGTSTRNAQRLARVAILRDDLQADWR